MILFDLDGVLVDSRLAFARCINHALRAQGLPERDEPELLDFIGPALADTFVALTGHPGDSALVAACVTSYRERYVDASLVETTAVPGIEDALDELGGERKAVATSKPRAFAEPLLRTLGLRDHFEHVAGPDLSIQAEDKAATIGSALRALGRPDEVVMVGDRLYDVIVARTHGIETVGVTWGFGSAAELEEAGAARLVDDPAELPDAIRELSATGADPARPAA